MAFPIAAAIAATAASSLINSGSQALTNSSNVANSKEMMREQMKWSEDMYNRYYSPSAQVRQMREAGINPALSAAELGSAASMPTSPAVTPPTQIAPNIGNFGDSWIRALQANTIDSQIDVNKASALKQIVDSSSEVAKVYGADAGKQILGRAITDLDLAEQNNYQNELDLRLKRDSFEYNLRSKYGENFAKNELSKFEQWYVESVARVGKIASDVKVNESTIKKVASEIVKNFSDARLAVSKSNEIDQLLPYLKSKLIVENGILGLQFGTQEAYYAGDSKIRDYLHDDVIQDDRVKSWMANPENRIETKIWQLIFQDLLRSGTTIGAASILSK